MQDFFLKDFDKNCNYTSTMRISFAFAFVVNIIWVYSLNLQKHPASTTKKIFSKLRSNQKNDIKTRELFSLDSVRSTMVRQEDTIIFALIERAQFRHNKQIYSPLPGTDLLNPDGNSCSLLDWMFIETESAHAKVRRYMSPEEHAFFPQYLPSSLLPGLMFPQLIDDTEGV